MQRLIIAGFNGSITPVNVSQAIQRSVHRAPRRDFSPGERV
jgi:hypothetical protein